jgi:nucleoside-diphosphate-sugar epimerase
MNWRTQTVFVTGATGFIGGRVCERMLQAGVPRVRALVHKPNHAARIARLPLELCSGDLLERDSLSKALGDAKVVIHCGLGPSGSIVRGTRNMLATAFAAGVQRFIHVSTAAIYGITPPHGSEHEDAPLHRTGNAYSDSKGAAEKVVLHYGKRGLPVVILRPSIVWGPYSAWNTRLMEDLRAGRVAFIEDGRGACNTTYVDNLIDAMALSIENDAALNQAFFITDGERVTWGDFIRAHLALMDPPPAVPEVSHAEIEANRGKGSGILLSSLKAMARVARGKELRQMLMQVPVAESVMKRTSSWVNSLPPEKRDWLRARFGVQQGRAPSASTRFIPDSVTVATQSTTVFFSIEKARNILGYEPRIHFADGMQRVEQWFRYAAYL